MFLLFVICYFLVIWKLLFVISFLNDIRKLEMKY